MDAPAVSSYPLLFFILSLTLSFLFFVSLLLCLLVLVLVVIHRSMVLYRWMARLFFNCPCSSPTPFILSFFSPRPVFDAHSLCFFSSQKHQLRQRWNGVFHWREQIDISVNDTLVFPMLNPLSYLSLCLSVSVSVSLSLSLLSFFTVLSCFVFTTKMNDIFLADRVAQRDLNSRCVH